MARSFSGSTDTNTDNQPVYLTRDYDRRVREAYSSYRPEGNISDYIESDDALHAENEAICVAFRRRRDEVNADFPHRHTNDDEYQQYWAARRELDQEHEAAHEALKVKAREQHGSWVDSYAASIEERAGAGWGDIVKGLFAIAGGPDEYSSQKIDVAELFPCRPTDIDKLARYRDWCGTYGALKQDAVASGLWGQIRALVADPADAAMAAYVRTDEFRTFVTDAIAATTGNVVDYQAKMQEYSDKTNAAQRYSEERQNYRTIYDLYSMVTTAPDRGRQFLTKFGLPLVEQNEGWAFVVEQVRQFVTSSYAGRNGAAIGAVMLHLFAKGYDLDQQQEMADAFTDLLPDFPQASQFYGADNRDKMATIAHTLGVPPVVEVAIESVSEVTSAE